MSSAWLQDIRSICKNQLYFYNTTSEQSENKIKKIISGGFPGGAVVKNPPVNAGDMGSSPGPGRAHMPRSN